MHLVIVNDTRKKSNKLISVATGLSISLQASTKARFYKCEDNTNNQIRTINVGGQKGKEKELDSIQVISCVICYLKQTNKRQKGRK